MRQVVITRYGTPDVLHLQTAPEPQPGPGEIRIAVAAAGVNFADILGRLGLYPDAPRPPFTPGYEVSGIVDRIGEQVQGVSPGDRVLSLTRFGGYASHVVVPAALAFPAPPCLDDGEAAAVPVNYLTAWVALHKFGGLERGETVLIHGAGGGVGLAAVQLARRQGATIIGIASRGKHETLRALGVAHVLDSTADLVEAVRGLTGNRGADLVLDSIGGASFRTSYRLLAPLGRLALYGVSSIAPGMRRSWWHALRTVAAMPRFKPLSLMNRNRGVFGINLAHLWDETAQLRRAMTQLLGEIEAGHIRPVIARSFPLDQAAEAHRFIQARRNIGKVVLRLTETG
jgi:synaptic vesicle membrane protein VAT-1